MNVKTSVQSTLSLGIKCGLKISGNID